MYVCIWYMYTCISRGIFITKVVENVLNVTKKNWKYSKVKGKGHAFF